MQVDSCNGCIVNTYAIQFEFCTLAIASAKIAAFPVVNPNAVVHMGYASALNHQAIRVVGWNEVIP